MCLHCLMRYKTALLAATLALTACDSEQSGPRIAAGFDSLSECSPDAVLAVGEATFSWQQLGSTIYGEAQDTRPGKTRPLIGQDVEMSADGSQVVVTVAYDVIRTYQLTENGLVQSAEDLINVGTSKIALSSDGNTLLRDVWYDVYGAGSLQIDRRQDSGNWTFSDQFFGEEHEWLEQPSQ